MRLAFHITVAKTIRSKGLAANMLAGLALGAIVVTAMTLPFGATYSAEPTSPMIAMKAVIERDDDNLTHDAWMIHSPLYETFPESSKVKSQSTPGDAWVFHSPYYENFPVGSSAEIQDTPIDAWMFDSPFYEEFQVVPMGGTPAGK